MSDIDCSTVCGSGLSMAAMPSSCGALDPGYPYLVLLAESGTELATADLAGIQTQMALETSAKLIVIGPFTNGVKKATEKETESGADTPDGLETVTERSTGVSGNLKTIDASVLTSLATLACHDRAQMWVVYSNGYLEGGVEGHLIPVNIDDFTHEGYGSKGKIPLDFNYKLRSGQVFELSTKDTDLLTLNNA